MAANKSENLFHLMFCYVARRSNTERSISCPDVPICCSYCIFKMVIIFASNFFSKMNALYDFPHTVMIKATGIARGVCVICQALLRSHFFWYS